jgi:hypothetical protein
LPDIFREEKRERNVRSDAQLMFILRMFHFHGVIIRQLCLTQIDAAGASRETSSIWNFVTFSPRPLWVVVVRRDVLWGGVHGFEYYLTFSNDRCQCTCRCRGKNSGSVSCIEALKAPFNFPRTQLQKDMHTCILNEKRRKSSKYSLPASGIYPRSRGFLRFMLLDLL